MASKESWRYENLQTARNVYRQAGKCIDCGEDRGKDGTTTRCRPCANKVNARNRAARRGTPERKS